MTNGRPRSLRRTITAAITPRSRSCFRSVCNISRSSVRAGAATNCFITLIEAGVTVRSELFSPAGLDLGAESPEEIALAIVAEIQATFAEAASKSLRERRRPIHCEADVALA